MSCLSGCEAIECLRIKKWNDNAGGVDGIPITRCGIIPRELQNTHSFMLIQDTIAEQDEGSDVSDTEEFADGDTFVKSERIIALEKNVLDIDIPQAFTHFTYVYSRPSNIQHTIMHSCTALGSLAQ